MEKILSKRSVAISEFKRAPNEIVAEANGEPLAVLTNNKPSFYVISPSAYEELLEQLWELEITPLLASGYLISNQVRANLFKSRLKILLSEVSTQIPI